jgi:hypothetical protein
MTVIFIFFIVQIYLLLLHLILGRPNFTQNMQLENIFRFKHMVSYKKAN